MKRLWGRLTRFARDHGDANGCRDRGASSPCVGGRGEPSDVSAVPLSALPPPSFHSHTCCALLFFNSNVPRTPPCLLVYGDMTPAAVVPKVTATTLVFAARGASCRRQRL